MYVFSRGTDILDFNNIRFRRVVTDWSVENVTPQMTQYVMSLDASIFPDTHKKKTKKHIIFIRLSFLVIKKDFSIKVFNRYSFIYIFKV